MKLIRYGAGILFFAVVMTALVMPAAAWQTTLWLEGGDGYMINNVIIEAGSISAETDDNNTTTGSASLSIYEWKNESWSRITGTSLTLSKQNMSFNATDGSYTVKVLDFNEVGRYNEVKLEIWTNASVTNNGTIDGGHSNATGAGKPELTITKVITPSENISVDDVITVMIYVNNSGSYDAKNVTIIDPYQQGFVMSNVTINNTVSQSINKNTNSTYLMYQLKAIEPGSYTLQKTTATGQNEIGTSYNYTQNNNVVIEVSDLAALTFNSSPQSATTVDYHTRTKVDGNITIRNTGVLPAQYISIDFTIPDNATISGKDITVNGNTATAYYDMITPNNQIVVEYSLSATGPGHFEVPVTYNYTYNNSQKTGDIQTIVYRAVGNSTVETGIEYWFLILIPIVLIIGAALFLWKRHREYKF